MFDDPNTLPAHIKFKAFATAQARDLALTSQITSDLSSGLTKHARTGFVGAGGGTPKGLYTHLSESPIDWSKITVTTSDAIVLPPAQRGDFPHVVETHLVQNVAGQADYLPLHQEGESGDQALTRTKPPLEVMFQAPVITVLGMGTDGHTASLYPHALGLKQALDLDTPDLIAPLAPTSLADQPFVRLSLTLRALLKSEKLYLILDGASKRDALTDFAQGGDPISAPTRALLTQTGCTIEVYWAEG